MKRFRVTYRLESDPDRDRRFICRAQVEEHAETLARRYAEEYITIQSIEEA